jgi:hypothetical protein
MNFWFHNNKGFLGCCIVLSGRYWQMFQSSLLPPSSLWWQRQANIYETSVSIYQTTQRNILKDSHLHIHHHKNLKPHLIRNFLIGRVTAQGRAWIMAYLVILLCMTSFSYFWIMEYLVILLCMTSFSYFWSMEYLVILLCMTSFSYFWSMEYLVILLCMTSFSYFWSMAMSVLLPPHPCIVRTTLTALSSN